MNQKNERSRKRIVTDTVETLDADGAGETLPGTVSESRKPAKKVPTRFSLSLPPSYAEIVATTAEVKELNVTDTFRRALAIMHAIDEEEAKGNRIVSVETDGISTRLVFV
ncbi:hypothetical protein [Agromyces sp. Leaf222]|uniref:hypothetical protein n=1 Tax=Agromyces sp. Leaf222 TaxID=1735688 RepID=UPI0006FFEE9A|nr:hypothetical protein [Agromyces sp. Leaf222]KQM82452.1 hypothetical protein ASE68_03440 [Agromyces sp. Leaf222]